MLYLKNSYPFIHEQCQSMGNDISHDKLLKTILKIKERNSAETEFLAKMGTMIV
jgi:hypothetical protein